MGRGGEIKPTDLVALCNGVRGLKLLHGRGSQPITRSHSVMECVD